MKIQYFNYEHTFELELGGSLDNFTLAYHTYGELNEKKDNVILVFHALTANSNVFEWWKGLFGENDFFNPNDYFIVCVNTIGSPYGSTRPYDLNFPKFTVRDVVNTQFLLFNFLQIDTIKIAIGGSFGGSQALEFAYGFTGKIEHLILIACAAQESAWGKAIHATQRLALQADSTFGKPNGGEKGLKAARAIGLLTYRTPEMFIKQQTDGDWNKVSNYKADSYINYQGDKFINRFDAICYYYLQECLDAHHLGRNRNSIEEVLQNISAKTLVIGIDSDLLLPTYLQEFIAQNIPNATFKIIHSEYGHDGFLIETEKISQLINQFLTK